MLSQRDGSEVSATLPDMFYMTRIIKKDEQKRIQHVSLYNKIDKMLQHSGEIEGHDHIFESS